jgi:hypothetical protein
MFTAIIDEAQAQHCQVEELEKISPDDVHTLTVLFSEDHVSIAVNTDHEASDNKGIVLVVTGENAVDVVDRVVPENISSLTSLRQLNYLSQDPALEYGEHVFVQPPSTLTKVVLTRLLDDEVMYDLTQDITELVVFRDVSFRRELINRESKLVVITCHQLGFNDADEALFLFDRLHCLKSFRDFRVLDHLPYYLEETDPARLAPALIEQQFPIEHDE